MANLFEKFGTIKSRKVVIYAASSFGGFLVATLITSSPLIGIPFAFATSTGSKSMFIVAIYTYISIWLHYICTEKEDFKIIYGNKYKWRELLSYNDPNGKDLPFVNNAHYYYNDINFFLFAFFNNIFYYF